MEPNRFMNYLCNFFYEQYYSSSDIYPHKNKLEFLINEDDENNELLLIQYSIRLYQHIIDSDCLFLNFIFIIT